MLWESSTLCHLELISNIHRQRDSIINEVCDEQADEVADTANLHGEYELRGCKQQNELDMDWSKMSPEIWMSHPLESQRAEAGRLSRLQNLNLSFNYLTGEIPVNLSHCVNLKSLVLEHNALLGKIPNQGQVPASFARLTKLRLLGLSVNSLSREFPPPLYNLSSLQSTNAPFEDNQFVGTLPHSTVNLSSQLQRLLYYGNKISGSIPIGNFSGMIPRTLGKCLALEEIYLKGNSLQGTIPNLEDLPDLQSLDLSLNNLSGPIPHFIANLTSFLYLNLSFNNLEDEISQLSLAMQLQVMFLEYDMGSKVSVLGDMYSFGILILEIFTGRRPTDTLFQAISSLHHFVETALPEKVMEILDKTTFHGAMSKATNGKEYWGSIKKEEMECLVSILEIGVACSAESARDRLTVTQVYTAFLGNEIDKLALLGFKSQITEDLSGVFVSWPNDSVHLCQWTGVKCRLRHRRVTHLNLKRLRLVGTFSGHLGNLSLQKMPSSTTQQAVKASKPEFESQLSNRGNSMKLYLRNNNQTGLFPGSIGNLTSLEELYLSYNNLEGQVPASLARLTKLRLPGLSVNSLSGEFPPPLYNLSSLELIALSFNNFSANASKLLELDFPINNFTGNIPKGFGNLRNLLWLNVWSNQFGHVKHDDLDFVNSLTNCRSLHFRDNQFVGTLPHSTVNLSSQLQSLLFYGNRISGSIPKEISNLVNLNLFELSNNNLTGSIPDSIGRLTNLGGLNFGNNLLTGLGNCSQQLALKFILTIVFAASFSILTLLVVFLYWRRNLKDQSAPEYRFKSACFYPNISYEELHTATGGFSSDFFFTLAVLEFFKGQITQIPLV
ncbi:hypothetical protein KY289_019325 [Solanum tuberosum]|nr:hypothetical protein KY289_019325 [Solanum tuberosum]